MLVPFRATSGTKCLGIIHYLYCVIINAVYPILVSDFSSSLAGGNMRTRCRCGAPALMSKMPLSESLDEEWEFQLRLREIGGGHGDTIGGPFDVFALN